MKWKEAKSLLSYVQPKRKYVGCKYDPIIAALERPSSEVDFLDPFGLRIACLYARYFGGELVVLPMEGHGTDIYVYLNCLTDQTKLQ